MLNQISKWRNDIIHEIDVHVKIQKQLLDEALSNWEQDLQQERQKALRQIKEQEANKNDPQIQQLLDHCSKLKYKLARIADSSSSIRLIQVIKENLVTCKQDDIMSDRGLNQESAQPYSPENLATATASNTADRNSAKPKSAPDSEQGAR